MSKTKAAGRTRQESPRPGKHLGIKIFGGEKVRSGNIIIRQRGTKFHPSEGVGLGKDHTIFALKDGVVQFSKKQGKNLIAVV